MKINTYNYNTLVRFVTMLFQQPGKKLHRRRVHALVVMVQGLLCLKQGWLSGLARGAAVLEKERTCAGQLKRAHRLMKNEALDAWEVGAALLAHMSRGQGQVTIAVDWTQMGRYVE